MRAAGPGREKRHLLGKLNEVEFVHLVADLLYFLHGHYDVKVMDGPGDGRRDIHSRTQHGDVHITQCKFVSEPEQSIGSRETDEIAIALAKFGGRHGAVATTGRLSPQAKREFMENYPNLFVSYFEGVDVVDAVLSQPLLTRAWFDGERIARIQHRLVLPFFLRDVRTDKPIDIARNKGNPRIRAAHVARSHFEPHRYASTYYEGEVLVNWVACAAVEAHATTGIHEIESLRDIAFREARNAVTKNRPAVSIRLGRAYLLSQDEDETDEGTLVPTEPVTWIVTAATQTPEPRWAVPQSNADWQYLDGVRSRNAEFATWRNQGLGVSVRIHLASPPGPHDTGFMRLKDEVDTRLWASSMFYVVPTARWKELQHRVGIAPHHVRKHFDGKLLVGWLHPQLMSDYRWYHSNGEVDPMPDTSVIERAMKGSKKLDSRLARYALAAQGLSGIFPYDEKMTYTSADLVSFIERIPSPLNMREREFLFDLVLHTSAEPEAVERRIKVVREKLGALSATWASRKGGSYIVLAKAYTGLWHPGNEVLAHLLPKVLKWKEQVLPLVRTEWPDAHEAGMDLFAEADLWLPRDAA